MHRTLVILAAAIFVGAPAASAHGALELNEFDVYALSDFEGHEESFAWEGWEIWDVYAGDGHHAELGGHGVYFKGNFAGDGSLRPTGGQVWELRFSWRLGDETFTRSITQDGSEVGTDFDALEWQVADGNVFQVHAWAIVPAWAGLAIEDLEVVSLVDGEPRDIAPGGIYDPATGTEIPVHVPPTPVFPEMGEGRILESVPLTGAGKFLNVTVTALEPGTFQFIVKNPLAQQGQHFMVHIGEAPGWTLQGKPNAASLDGGTETTFVLQATPQATGRVEPLAVELLTDVGGRQTFYVYQTDVGVALTQDASMATPYAVPEPAVESPGIGAALVLVVVALVGLRRR